MSGLKLPQDAIHRQRIKQEHIIHAFESGEDLRALGLRLERASFPFERRHAGVAVNPQYQYISKRPGFLQISDVADVEEIKTAVGKHDFPSCGAQRSDGFL